MKTVLNLILLFFVVNMYSQKNEQKIIDCIKRNTKSVGLDLNLEIKKIKNDLIENKIINSEFSSIRMKFKEIKKFGEIKQTRNYESILFHQVGLKTINYCVSLNHYSNESKKDNTALLMFGEILRYSYNNFSDSNFKTLIRNTASIIDKYLKDEYENSELWNIISISFLYQLTTTQEMKNIIDLPEFNNSKPDTSNLVKLFVNRNNEIIYKNNKIEINKICENIMPSLEQGFGLGLMNERQTKYKIYLKVS